MLSTTIINNEINLFCREIGMNDKNEYLQTRVYAERQDDLRELRQTFSLPEINYIDIARQTRLARMMERWPLLAEQNESAGGR
ncbi:MULTISPECIES: cellulose biosynthesis protein BcsR [unclassified Brenneria]|uniref:cellulose biosynthesis protein BcsR n=2 Tax=unclassified Brenneria TaxID=2634434 RepID=UPI0039B524B6